MNASDIPAASVSFGQKKQLFSNPAEASSELMSSQKQFTFGGASQSSRLGSSLSMSAMKLFNAPTEKEKEEKLSRIREMEERMRQLQQEKQSIHAVVNDRGERAALIEANSKLQEYIMSLEQQLRVRDGQYLSANDTGDFEDKMSRLIAENKELAGHVQSAQHELSLLMQQKEVDAQTRRAAEERLISAERVNEKLEERLSTLRDEMIQVQFTSSRDTECVTELKAAYSKLNAQLDLELRGKKALESQLITAKQAMERVKALENECKVQEAAQERLKAQNKELAVENAQLKQQYLSENQKSLNLEKTSIKVYQISKEFEVSQNHLKDVQLSLAAAERGLQDKEQKVTELLSRNREQSMLLEMRATEELTLRDQLSRAAEKRAGLEKQLSDLELQIIDKDAHVLKLKRDIDGLTTNVDDLQVRLQSEISAAKESRQKESSAKREQDRLAEELQRATTTIEHLQEKLIKASKLSMKEADDNTMMLEEIKAQQVGEVLQLNSRLSSLSSQYSDLQVRHESMTFEFEEVTKKLQQTKSKLDSEHAQLRGVEQQSDAKDEVIKELSEQVSNLRAREEKQSEQLSKITSQTKMFTTEKDNHIREMQKLTEVKIKLADRQIAQKDAELQKQNAQIAELQRTIIELEQHASQVDHLQADLQTSDEELRDASQRIDQLEKSAIEKERLLKDLEGERVQLAGRIQYLEAELNTFKEQLKAAKQTEKHLREEKHASKQLLDRLNEEVKSLTAALRDAGDKLNAIDVQTNVSKNLMKDKQIEEQALQISTLKVKLDAQLMASAQREEELSTATQDVADLGKSLKSANKRVATIQEELENAQDEVVSLKAKVNQLNSSNELNTSQLESRSELETQVGLLRNKEKKHVDTIAKLQTEVSRLEIVAEDLMFQKKTVELALAKANIQINQESVKYSTHQSIAELELQIQELIKKNQQLEAQINADPKVKLYQKYALPFDPLHPEYNATLKKTQSQQQLPPLQTVTSSRLQSPFSPRRSQPLPGSQQQQQQYVNLNQLTSPSKQQQPQLQYMNNSINSSGDLYQNFGQNTRAIHNNNNNNNVLFPQNNGMNAQLSSNINNNNNVTHSRRNMNQLMNNNNNVVDQSEDGRIFRHIQDLTRMY